MRCLAVDTQYMVTLCRQAWQGTAMEEAEQDKAVEQEGAAGQEGAVEQEGAAELEAWGHTALLGTTAKTL